MIAGCFLWVRNFFCRRAVYIISMAMTYLAKRIFFIVGIQLLLVVPADARYANDFSYGNFQNGGDYYAYSGYGQNYYDNSDYFGGIDQGDRCTGRIVDCDDWGPCKESFYSGTQQRRCYDDCGRIVAPGGPGTTRDCSYKARHDDRERSEDKCTGRVVSCDDWGPCIRSFYSGTQQRRCYDDCGRIVEPGGRSTTRSCGGIHGGNYHGNSY